MFKIYDGREHFYQWDSDRKLIVEDPSITEVHFCNRTDDCSLVCEIYVEDGVTLVNVPNILLQTDWRIKVYAYDSNYTKYDTCYDVVSRTKPADYVYTETEIKNYKDLDARIKKLEDNPVVLEETDPTVPAWAKAETKPSYTAAEVGALPDTTAIPAKVSELENDAGYVNNSTLKQATDNIYELVDKKAPKTVIMSDGWQSMEYDFNRNHNIETRLSEATIVSFTFGNGVYPDDYISGLSFDSGETPTAIDYTSSGILNWVGTDCSTADGLSIFQPSANTRYDIVFYFNGKQFIGLVNGYVPATGNEAA